MTNTLNVTTTKPSSPENNDSTSEPIEIRLKQAEATFLANQLEGDYQQHQQNLLATVLKWANGFLLAAFVINSSWFLWDFWNTFFMNAGLAVLIAIGWWGRRAIRRGQNRWVAQVYILGGMIVMAGFVLVIDETLILGAVLGMLLFLFLANYLTSPQLAVYWTVACIGLYVLALMPRYLGFFRELSSGNNNIISHIAFPIFALITFAFLAQNLAVFLNKALLRSETIRAELERSHQTLLEARNSLETLNTQLSLELTERQQIEKALRESEVRYRSLVETSPDSILLMNLEGVILLGNQRSAKLYGYEKTDHMVNQSIFDFIAPEERGNVLDEMQKIFKVGSIGNIEYTVHREDDTQVPVEASTSVIQSVTKQPQAFVSVVRDISERKLAEKLIKASLHEKEILLKEIHHRVKNNMQIVSSLLNLQTQYVEDHSMKDLFFEAQKRVRSMALVHERLYHTTNLSKIDLVDYLQDLTRDLHYSYTTGTPEVSMDLDLEPIRFNIDTAIPCGLIVNELVSNALKYAFSNGQNGKIRIEGHILSDEQYQYHIIITDDGVGLPADIDFRETQSLGLQLVNNLVQQLNGTIELDRTHGTTFQIKIGYV